MSLLNERTSPRNRISGNDRVLRGASLTWRRDDTGSVLLAGRRCFGRVVPDSKYPGMWRSTLSGGRLSDMANLAWAKNAVLAAAERELEWEDRQRPAIALPKCPEKRGVFESAAPPVASTDLPATPLAEPLPKTPGAERADEALRQLEQWQLLRRHVS